MTDWERVKEELRDAGYPGFGFDSGETAVPGLSGEWVVGRIPREENVHRENQPFLIRVFDAFSLSGGAVNANPENAPESIRKIANRHGVNVVIISVQKESVRIALCDPSKPNTPS